MLASRALTALVAAFVVTPLIAAEPARVVVRLRVEPPQPVSAIALRAGGNVHSFAVREGAVSIPAELPLPWTVSLVRFEPTTYTRTDLERHAVLLVRELGAIRVRLDPSPPADERVQAYLLRSGESVAREVTFLRSSDRVLEASLPSGVYATAFVGTSRATRIRSGVVVNPGSPTELGTLSFDPTGSATLHVIDGRSQAAITGAIATWSPPDALNANVARVLFARLWSATTDKRGRAVVRCIGPPPVPVQWSVQATGYAATQTARVLISDTRQMVIPDTSMRPEASLIVKVHLPRPADDFRGASLLLSEREDEESRHFREIARRPLIDGENRFRLSAFGLKRISIADRSGRQLLFHDVEIAPEDLQVTLTPTPAEISGAVSRAGTRLANVKITAGDGNDARVVVGRAKTDEEGRYSMRVYHVGTVLLYTTGAVNGQSVAAALKTVKLAGQAEYHVDFDLPVAGINLSVVDAQSHAPVRARVQSEIVATDGSGRGAVLETDENGRLELSGYPDATATFFVKAKGYYSREMTAVLRAETPSITIELTKAPALSGHVVDKNGVAVSGARILGGFSSPSTTRARFEAITDTGGSFHFDETPDPGTVLYAVAPGFALSWALARGEEVSIRLSPLNSGAVKLVVDNAPPKKIYLMTAAPSEGEIIPLRILRELALVNGMSPYQFMSTGVDGTLILPQFLAQGNYVIFNAAQGTGPSEPFRYVRVADLSVPASDRAVLAMKEP